MSFKEPGIIFDASNSWNGYVHQGKVALYEAIKTICDLWDADKTTAENKAMLSNYFLELEYFEDFSIGKKIDDNQEQYLTVHQVKNKEDTKLSSYDSAILGLIQHVQDHPNIIKAYLHVTGDLKTSDEAFSEHVLQICKTPKFIDDEIKNIGDKRGDTDFRAELLKKRQGRRTALKQNLFTALKEMNLQSDGLTAENLDKAIDYHLERLSKKKAMFAAVDKNSIEKVKIYEYPTGEKYCSVDNVNELVISALERYYRTDTEYQNSYKITSREFHKKCLFYLSEKINEHVRERDLNYHDYAAGLKDRRIFLNEILEWIKSDKIDDFDKEYYLYHVRERIFEVVKEYCKACIDKNNCKANCGIEEFKYKLANMDFEELEKFTYFSNPQFKSTITIKSYPDFATSYCYKQHFADGLKNIEKEFLSDKMAVTYHDDENKECVLTTVIDDVKEANAICSEIVKNRNIYPMMMDSDYLISKCINVDSIEDTSLSPVYAENIEENAHIARCKKVKIISLNNFLNKIRGGQE